MIDFTDRGLITPIIDFYDYQVVHQQLTKSRYINKIFP
jgi:hypothetical protein